MKKYIRDYTFLFLIAGSIILLDQWTKHLVRSNLDYTEMWSPWPWLMPYLRIVNWQNTGAAFGILPQLSIVFTILPIIIAGAIIYYFPKVPRSDWPIQVALGLQLGGALGNLIDRLTRGYVTDFVSMGNFAVYNVADASITIGTVILITYMWFKERNKPPNEIKQTPEEEASPGERIPNPGQEE